MIELFQRLLDLYEVSIVKFFGYEMAVRVEELLYGLGMLFLGMRIMLVIMAMVILFAIVSSWTVLKPL